jgi:DNA-binding transcriptional ArsR family regulator
VEERRGLSKGSITLEQEAGRDYLSTVAKPLHHPEPSQITLSAVLEALSDPIRRGIVQRLAQNGERSCAAFHALASKTNLSYHLARLRTAGLVRVRPEGTCRMLSLRSDDVEARFPGLLQAVLASAGVGATRAARRARKSRRASNRPRAALEGRRQG